MELKNSTTAFFENLGSTQGRLVRVEVLVLFSTLVWILLELFGALRRRYSHEFFRLFVWAVYTLSTVLAPYTIGLLQAGPFRDQTFVLWGTILLLIQVSVHSLSVYSIHDTGERKRMLVQYLLQIILVLWLIFNYDGSNTSYSATIWTFWAASIVKVFLMSRSLGKAGNKGGLLEQSKVVADYMIVEHELLADADQGVNIDPKTMAGYRYIFHGEMELASLLPSAPEYVLQLKEQVLAGNKLTTIDSAMRWIESDNFFKPETMKTVKDIALSFSLFKLLKRRFCGYRLGEAGLPKTINFVLHGLLSETSNYVRAFGVIETELAFMYDFLYTSFGVRFGAVHSLWVFVLPIAAVWHIISGALSRHYHRTNLEQRVNETDVIHWITIVLLVLFGMVTFMDFGIQPFRWTIVSQLHRELQKGGRAEVKSFKLFTKSFRKEKGCWERKLGQYPLLVNFDYHPWNVLPCLSLNLVDAKREGQMAGEKIVLPVQVVVHVLSRFKDNNGKLENGQSALAKHHMGSRFSWACALPTHAHMILVWHIGTTMCTDKASGPLTNDRRVAESLSDYCAYLVAFVPGMLPGHAYDTQRIFDAVVVEAWQRLGGCRTLSSRCEKLVDSWGNCDTILELGGRLGKELRNEVPDEAQRWKMLADFWADFILFLAPSTNTDIHAEMLAAGGEFMTHLWALLTHAGILDRPSSSDTPVSLREGIMHNHTSATAQDSAV